MGAGASAGPDSVKNASQEDLKKFAEGMPAEEVQRLLSVLTPKTEVLKAEKKAEGVAVALIFYSMYGHILEMAKEVKKGLEEKGVQVDMFQVPETLPDAALKAMGAPAKPADIMTLDHESIGKILPEYDGFVFGIPTRFANMCGQIKSFWDSTGGLWGGQKLAGKLATCFVSTGTQNGGQELTHLQTISSLVHHGITYVPLGYGSPGEQFNMSELHGGSPWGASTFAGPDGSRMPSDTEKKIAKTQAEMFAGAVKRSKQTPVEKTVKIAIVYYSMYGHIKKLADSIAEGAKKEGVEVDFYQVNETLPDAVLTAMGAPPKPDIPTIGHANIDTLCGYDGIMFGLPTRFGQPAAQIKTFWDATGGLWGGQKLARKLAASFVSTGTQQGGQETTHLTHLSHLVHHGMIYVPLGYATPELFDMSEFHGGSPWGASTLTNGDGSRMPSELELKIAAKQGSVFALKVKAMAEA
mmetsp:Transcript_18151/g.34085  ORF Transcript_18151/g.34085 Transcript_18151/m.34085 type:complete len:467 (-) Transcript_18151:138-1538(-)